MAIEARVPSRCATCQQEGFLAVSQSVVGAELRWVERFACACGHGFEASGKGFPAPAVRRALLEQCGGAEVWLDAISPGRRAALVRVLVTLTGRRETQVSAKLRRLPVVVFVGTVPEAEVASTAIARAGARCRVVTPGETIIDG